LCVSSHTSLDIVYIKKKYSDVSNVLLIHVNVLYTDVFQKLTVLNYYPNYFCFSTMKKKMKAVILFMKQMKLNELANNS